MSCKETAAPDAEGWILMQKRGQFGNPVDYFGRTFSEYEDGFGSVLKEHWIGLAKLASLTNEAKWDLKVTLVDWEGGKYTALFHNFRVGYGPTYELEIGEYNSGASNIDQVVFSFHNMQAFSSKDRDQDALNGSCSRLAGQGGWWYKNCYSSNLNGLNIQTSYIKADPNSSNTNGITTIDRQKKITSYKETKMEIRKLKL